MATLQEHQTKEGVVPLGRGTVSRQLGAKPAAPTVYVDKPSGLPAPVQKIANVGKQLGGVGAAVGKKIASYAANTAVDIAKTGFKAATSLTGDAQNINHQNKLYRQISDELDRRTAEAHKAYARGDMSKENYKKVLDDTSKGYGEINKETQRLIDEADPEGRAAAVLETGATILSTGSLKLAQVGGKQALQAGSKEAIESLVTQAATPLEKVALRSPALKDLIVRNLSTSAKILASESEEQFIKRNARQLAVDLLIKRPVFYQTNIAQATDMYDDILKGDYKGALTNAAWLGSQMVQGGPIGIFFKGKDYFKGGLKKLAYGRESFIDTLSSRIGDGNPAQIARFLTKLEKKAPNEFKEAERTFRILQETNLRTAGDNVGGAVDNVLTHYVQSNIDPSDITPSKLFKDMNNWAKADEIGQNALKSGLVRNVPPEDAARYVVVRWDQTARQGLINAYKKNGIEGVAELMNRPGVGWANNSILVNRIEAVANQAKNFQEFESGIKAIAAVDAKLSGLPKSVANQLAKLGYSLAAPVGGRITPVIDDINETRRLVSGAVRGNTEIFDPAIAPNPDVKALAGWIQKAGLSPEASNEIANKALAESVVANLDQSVAKNLGITYMDGDDTVNGGRAVLTKLKQFVEDKPAFLNLGKRSAVTDIRQLTNREIAHALKISVDEAKDISRAIIKGYQDVPLEFRGLGDRVVDTLFRINPAQKYYSRIQAALRYTYNPFFRTQERVETALLSRAQANNLMWNKSKAELNAAAQVLDDAGIFTSTLPGEAAQDVVLGRITANITQGQKRDLAGLALDIAKARGVDLQTLVTQHADEVDDALRVVVQYPKTGLLASPLARTMNLAFFPMRYNLKVTQLAAQTLAKQPPSVQKAVLHSMFQTREWLKSDEGIRWQRDNADAIQVLKWVTPVNSIEYTMGLLNGIDAPGELGQLGGLPLGFITQILDGQGIINLNKPYVNPKTGDVLPEYIPKTTKARAATALGDIINTMFTYPGRILGMPGKEAQIREAVQLFIKTNGRDFDKQINEDQLTPLQKNWVRVLKGDMSEEALDSLYTSPAPGQFNWYTIPPLDLPIRTAAPAKTQLEPRRGLQSSKKASSGPKPKKVAQPL